MVAVAVVGVMILGVVDGMLVAVALSIAATLQRMSSPTIATLGKLGESRNFVDVTYMPEARTDPQIIVLRPSQPLFFRECGSDAFPHRRPRDVKRRAGGDLEPRG